MLNEQLLNKRIAAYRCSRRQQRLADRLLPTGEIGRSSLRQRL
ncbi:hypothetical protein LTSEALA_0887 [Salmonella enterica subsp. enterica serovar Alachua str. R6-377]|uniref:Uncharacterized protein n=1 Tax=Salmonella enterica subsp. enterica serovar Alachua str. R6-377 TaxID=913241 RepID=G5LKI4_SALET|nr:hypothetical protein LTSEALA_0887 [Salmonella enterica subsp. enterica serovar Alachua str. R6-377]